MSSSIVKFALGAALLSAAACSDNAANARARADSDLARDLALAGTQTVQPNQPTFKDTAVAPSPTLAAPPKHNDQPAPVHVRTKPKPVPQAVAQAPAPQPPPAVVPAPVMPAPTPVYVSKEIASGAAASMTSGAKACTNSSLPGDKITATLSSSLSGSNGAEIPAGSTVILEVASVNPGQSADNASITFRVRKIVVGDKTYDVNADASPLDALEKTKVADSDPNAEKKKVAGGAIAGAILGQIIGHNTKGTLIGAAAGAAAGAAVSHTGQKWEACLPAGAAMRLKLTSSMIVS